MLITNEGIIIRISVDGISQLGRVTSGVKLMNLDSTKNVKVASIAKVRDDNTPADSENDETDEEENTEVTE